MVQTNCVEQDGTSCHSERMGIPVIYYGGTIQEIDTNTGNADHINPVSINCCGYIKIDNENVSINRTRVDYYLIYLINGAGYYRHGGKVCRVPAGNIVLYQPLEKQDYYYLGDERTELYWIHFTGTEVQWLLGSLGLSNKFCCETGFQTECINLFEKIIQEIHMNNPHYHMLCISYLIDLLSLFSRENAFLQKQKTVNKNSDIQMCIKKMQMEYQENHDMGYYASSCNLNVSQFIRKFKTATKITPAKYVEKIRIDKSKELITDTDLAISQISDIVGFNDPFYFSKVFKKVTGMNPLLFKKAKSNGD